MRGPKVASLRFMARLLVIWGIASLALMIIAMLFPDNLTVESWYTPIIAAAAIGLLNALIWPALIRIALPIAIYTFGVLVMLLNGIIIMMASQLVPGFFVHNLSSGVGVAAGLSILTTGLGGLLSIDEDYSWYSMVIQRQIQRGKKYTETDVPGIIFLEIDGLAAPVLQAALRQGYMPTLQSWIARGSHRLVQWETDLSSQTSASQAGILHGTNTNIPAFAYYVKPDRRRVISSHPPSAARIEKEHSDGRGLLACDGASRTSMFSGDAPNVMITTSSLFNPSKIQARQFYAYFLNPYNFYHSLGLILWDTLTELWYGLGQMLRDERPRIRRIGIYPFIRAAATAFLPDIDVATLMGDMFGGIPAAYATFSSYDEVAHHSGIERKDALGTLRRLDKQFARLEKASVRAPRPYRFVVLSDHGQVQGATFKQRYGKSLRDLVRSLISEDLRVEEVATATDAWMHFNDLLNDATRNENKLSSRTFRHAFSRRTYEGTITTGPDHEIICRDCDKRNDVKKSNVIVTYSGNLGLIYFADWPERLSLEEINQRFPLLLPGLIEHEGVGFVMVRSKEHGAVALGKSGIYFLEKGHIQGKNPLEIFGPNTARHLLREDSFRDCPDLLVNSFYNPETGEVASFEELVGSHGGQGGSQTQPFILYPSSLSVPDKPIVGAVMVYQIFKGWVTCSAQGNDAPD
ncbi:MAG TPA: phage holin family protein [Methanotrichaceae archaeon]|nr:phage holin family protein [Methanotrichaceae archaeon]